MPYPAGFEYSSYRSKSYGGPKTEELIKAPRNTKWKAEKILLTPGKKEYTTMHFKTTGHFAKMTFSLFLFF